MPFLFPSPRALMQLASAKRLRLILAPSLSRIPRFSVTVPLSEPAKSISDNLDSSTEKLVPFFLSRILVKIWKIAWDLEDVKLALVDSVVRLRLPSKRIFMISLVFSTFC